MWQPNIIARLSALDIMQKILLRVCVWKSIQRGNQNGRLTTNMGGTIPWAGGSGCIQRKDGERELSVGIDSSLLPDHRHTVTCFLTPLPSCLPSITLPPSSCFCQVFATAKGEKKLIHMVSKNSDPVDSDTTAVVIRNAGKRWKENIGKGWVTDTKSSLD